MLDNADCAAEYRNDSFTVWGRVRSAQHLRLSEVVYIKLHKLSLCILIVVPSFTSYFLTVRIVFSLSFRVINVLFWWCVIRKGSLKKKYIPAFLNTYIFICLCVCHFCILLLVIYLTLKNKCLLTLFLLATSETWITCTATTLIWIDTASSIFARRITNRWKKKRNSHYGRYYHRYFLR